jgi:hypothetical protein
VKRSPGILLQKLRQSQFVGFIQLPASLQPGRHQLGKVPIADDRHADHRPLRHRIVVLVALKRAGILPDLQADEDEREDHADRAEDRRRIG